MADSSTNDVSSPDFVLCIGDDRSDEDMFATVEGVTVQAEGLRAVNPNSIKRNPMSQLLLPQIYQSCRWSCHSFLRKISVRNIPQFGIHYPYSAHSLMWYWSLAAGLKHVSIKEFQTSENPVKTPMQAISWANLAVFQEMKPLTTSYTLNWHAKNLPRIKHFSLGTINQKPFDTL